MKRNISLLASLILSSTVFWGMPAVETAELVIREGANLSFYCHMKFSPMRANTLSRDRPVLDESAANVIDFYGACDYDPTGPEEVRIQRRILRRDFFGDGD